MPEEQSRETGMSIQERLNPDKAPVRAQGDGETGWLIEENAGGVIQWIALRENVWQRGWYVSEFPIAQPSPVCRVRDSNQALRFARQCDAEAFISLFRRFLLLASATEHCWNAAAVEPRSEEAT